MLTDVQKKIASNYLYFLEDQGVEITGSTMLMPWLMSRLSSVPANKADIDEAVRYVNRKLLDEIHNIEEGNV